MVQRQTQAKKPRAVLRHECGSCGEIFTGKTCPNCAEETNIFRVNKDGTRLDDVASAVGATHSLPPIVLQQSPDTNFNAESAMALAKQQRIQDAISDATLDKALTQATEQAAKRLRAEKELEATEKGFLPVNEGEEKQQMGNQMTSAMFMQALGGWNPEARESLLDRLHENPEFAFNLSRLLNPQPGMPGMPQMNPMGWMGGMLSQPQPEPAPQTSAADMLTAVIAAVGALRDMSGGEDKADNAQMARILDKMDEMRKETESLKLQLVEERNQSKGVSHDEMRLMIADAVHQSSAQQANIDEGVRVLDSLKSLKTGMVELGLMEEVRRGDDKPTIEDRRLDHEIKMDELAANREHELRLETERSQQAAAATKGMFIDGLFSAAASQDTKEEDVPKEEEEVDVVKADNNRQAQVIS